MIPDIHRQLRAARSQRDDAREQVAFWRFWAIAVGCSCVALSVTVVALL